MDSKQIINQLHQYGLIPIAVVDQPNVSLLLAKILEKNGLNTLEITCRTPNAISCIQTIHKQMPDFLLGAGTIKTVIDAEKASLAGAKYLVSPAFDLSVAEWCKKRGIPYIPGITTITEIHNAVTHGFTLLKFFPASQSGGIKMLQTFESIYPEVSFIPTGGLNFDNFGQYISLKNVFACGGSWLCPSALISQQSFEAIDSLVQNATQILHNLGS